jgi:hypothetical protein
MSLRNGASHRGHVMRGGSPAGTDSRTTMPRSAKPATRPANAPAMVQPMCIVVLTPP